jgi:hypothetical protein
VRITRANSDLNRSLASWTLGCFPRKIKSFRAIRMLQLIRMMVSMEKKHIQLNPEMLETSCGNPGGTVRCCRFQQSQAKGQFRRPHAALFKSLLNLKLAKDTIVRLHIIVLPSYELRVLSRSFNNNQNKTLCFL